MGWIEIAIYLLLVFTFGSMLAVVVILERGVRSLQRLEKCVGDLRKTGEDALTASANTIARVIPEERHISSAYDDDDVGTHAAMPQLNDDEAEFERYQTLYPDTKSADAADVCTGWHEQDERLAAEEDIRRTRTAKIEGQIRPKSWLDRMMG